MAAGAALLRTSRGRAEPVESEPAPPESGFRETTLTLRDRKGNQRRAVVYVREPVDSDRKQRAVVLLHGYGQATNERRALGAWKKDYGLLDAYSRLARPPIEASRKARFLSDARLEELNTEVSQRPVGDLVFICPVTPIPYYDTGRGEILDCFADFVEEELLIAARRVAPIDERGVGLAGISMGGHVGLELLVRKPALFDAFAGIMVAIERADVTRYANRVQAALEARRALPMMILTASSDVYRVANESLSRALQSRGLDVQLRCPPGIHTSDWMRELGSLEMLLWQDRTLSLPAEAGTPAPPTALP